MPMFYQFYHYKYNRMNQKKPLLNYIMFIILIVCSFKSIGQNEIKIINNLSEIANAQPGIHNFWLEMGSNTYGYPMLVPIIVIQGQTKGPTLGLTAAIHGNELNGIPIIHNLVDEINVVELKGRIIAIPGLNHVSIQMDERRFIDEEDLNRNFPGKQSGNRSEQYGHNINEKILPYFNFLIDMHTASFGRVNSMYARADFTNDTLKMLGILQKPDIILNSKGKPSVGSVSASSYTMREAATLKNIPCITVEYGDPQVFQKELIERGYHGILNTLSWLKMYGDSNIENFKDVAVYCKKSYWLYMKEGGFLDVIVELNEKILKGDKIAIVKNAFGTIIREYFAPEEGIVIGKSTNPANMSGGRIIHLGIMN
jgi:predicted deacylase